MRGSARGIALVAVLWMTAALAIVVAGMSFAVRVDSRLASDHLEAARARALLDGALRLAAADLVAQGQPTGVAGVSVHRIGNAEVHTRAIPASGYISVNDAPESLLVDLFRYAAELPDEQALVLAQRVIDWRDADDRPQPYGAERNQYLAEGREAVPRNENFRHPDDLGQVLGMDPAVHDKIVGLITVTRGGAGAVNPIFAPMRVLHVLARGDPSLLQQMLDGRQAGEQTGAYSSISASSIEQGHMAEWQSNDYRLEAMLETPDGAVWTRAAWLSARPTPPVAGGARVPWTWLYAESPWRGARHER